MGTRNSPSSTVWATTPTTCTRYQRGRKRPGLAWIWGVANSTSDPSTPGGRGRGLARGEGAGGPAGGGRADEGAVRGAGDAGQRAQQRGPRRAAEPRQQAAHPPPAQAAQGQEGGVVPPHPATTLHRPQLRHRKKRVSRGDACVALDLALAARTRATQASPLRNFLG